MKVQLEKTFPLPASADTAWILLRDIPAVAGCMPGARITEQVDDRHYKGTVAVKFGPANMAFRGEVEVQSLEPATRTLRLLGKGTDTTGGSGASMDLTARLDAVDPATCNLVGTSEVAVNGKAAAFGGRMMGSVADQVLKQFADNFAARAKALRDTAAPPDTADKGAGTAGTEPAPAMMDAAPTEARATPLPGGAEPPTRPSPVASGAAPAAPTATVAQLDGLTLLWAIVKDWLRALFAARRA